MAAYSADFLAQTFACYLWSNLAWLYFASVKKQLGLLVMNIVYLFVSIFGLYHHLQS